MQESSQVEGALADSNLAGFSIDYQLHRREYQDSINLIGQHQPHSCWMHFKGPRDSAAHRVFICVVAELWAVFRGLDGCQNHLHATSNAWDRHELSCN